MGKNLKVAALLGCITSIPFSVLSASYVIDEVPVLSQESQHGAAINRLTQFFTRSHYLEVELTDELSNRIFDKYLKSLDRNKLFLIKSDVQAFEQLRLSFDDAIKKRNLSEAYKLFNLSTKRRFERFSFALELLKREMKFDKPDEYVFDREELDWATTQEELNEAWRQRVKFDALSLKLTGKEWDEIQTVLTKRYTRAIKQLIQAKSEDAFQIAMNAYASSIETHTKYLSPRNADRFKMEMNLSLEGIGAVLQADEDYTVIRSLVPGGPADKTESLKPTDKIIGVAQGDKEFVDVIGWRLDDVVELIKGPKGTSVRLQVLSGDSASTSTDKDVLIVRDKIKLEDRAAKSEVFEPVYSTVDSKIGVISIPSFYNNLSRDVKKEIASLAKEQVEAIVIDLRNNGGGSLSEATRLTGLFIEQGPVVQIRQGRGAISVNSDKDRSVAYDGPLTVLVNRFSASASEIFAAALQDYGRAVIIGEQTFGKGTVQQHRDLGRVYDLYENPFGSVQYTMAKFYRINGGSTQHKGVIPDINFPSNVPASEWGESQEDDALPWDQIRVANYVVQGDLSEQIQYTTNKHKLRVAKEPEFNYLLQDISEYQIEKDKKTVSLVQAERKKRKEETKIKSLARVNERLKRLNMESVDNLDDLPEALEDIDPFLEETINITADFVSYGKLAKK